MKQPIIIDTTVHDRMVARFPHVFGKRIVQAREYDTAIDGVAITFQEPVTNGKEIFSFQYNCFREWFDTAALTHFQIDHDEQQRVASTERGLAFEYDGKTVLFRLDLEKAERGPEIKTMVDSGTRSAVSIGFEVEDSEVAKVGEHDVRFVTKAKILELSIVGTGACTAAFAGTISTENAVPLASAPNSTIFKLNETAHKLNRSAKAMAGYGAKMKQLNARLDELEAEEAKPKRTFSDHDYFEAQRERHDELVAHSRQAALRRG